MPNLKIVHDIGKWGDMILLADIGRIYSIDALGRLGLAFGSPITYDKSGPGGLNDDGTKNRCVDIAFQHLGLDTEPIKKFRESVENPDTAPTSQELVNILLSTFEKLNWKGMVGDFIKQHPTGKYYVSCFGDYTETTSHAFALVEGTAFNINFRSPIQEIDHVWKIE